MTINKEEEKEKRASRKTLRTQAKSKRREQETVNAKIGHYCGWFEIRNKRRRHEMYPYLIDHPEYGPLKDYPDYEADLDAMHDAEALLTAIEAERFNKILRNPAIFEPSRAPAAEYPWHTPAARRAKAFLEVKSIK